VEEVQVRVDLSLFVIKTTKDDSLELSRFIVAYFFVLLFITSCTTTHQLNNSSSLQINTSDVATGTGFLFSSSDMEVLFKEIEDVMGMIVLVEILILI
jgi:hypothetical protein